MLYLYKRVCDTIYCVAVVPTSRGVVGLNPTEPGSTFHSSMHLIFVRFFFFTFIGQYFRAANERNSGCNDVFI